MDISSWVVGSLLLAALFVWSAYKSEGATV